VPNCLVLDVVLPDLDGLDLQRRVAADRIGTPIIFITGHGDVPMSVRAMKAGAVEFLTKPCGNDALLSAIHSCLERSRTALRTEANRQALRQSYASLTGREREVMTLVVAGLLNKRIAATLGIREITVKFHRARVMRKMQADSIAGLVRKAASLNLTLPSDTPSESMDRAAV
jgi:FixJ family two-component response regulator